MKKLRKLQTLTLRRETLHYLESRHVAGGFTATTCNPTCYHSCLENITCPGCDPG